MSGNSGRVVKNADEKPIVLKKPRLSVEEAKSSLRGRELELVRWLGISWPPRKKASHITCPIPGHKDRRPSWRWDDSRTRWICTCGSGDLIQLIQDVKGLDFPGAMDLIADFLGRKQPQPPVRAARSARPAAEEEDADEDQAAALKRKQERAFQLWTEAQGIPGTLGQVYFEQHRGVVIDWAAVHNAVRFHPKLWCSEREGHFPAILFRVSVSHDGETLTVHRLYLGEDGDKAKIANPKKAYGDYKGGGVWFGKPVEGGHLVKAEGPENTLVCFMAGRPFAVSAIGAANLKNIEPPSTVKAVLIAGDRGRGADGRKAGEDYAEAAALADKKRGFAVALTYPPARPNANGKWDDWNDLLKSDGLDAVREALAQSEPWEDLPPGFRWREGGGIEFLACEEKVKLDGSVEEEVWEWLCSPVEFLATTLNPESKDWGLWLRIKTRNGFWHKAAIPKTDLVTSSEDIFKHLAYHGLEFAISARGKNKLKELLTRVRPRSYALCVPKIGFVELTKSKTTLRKTLQALEGVAIGEHKQEVEKLAIHDHGIKFVRLKEGDRTCVPYALGLSYNRTYRSLADWAEAREINPIVVAGPEFVAWLLEGRLHEIDEPRTACLVCYFSNSQWKHIGIVGPNDKVTSKWGQFPLYEHAFDEVGEDYGDEVRFFERPLPEVALVLFLEFAAENGVSSEVVEAAVKDCSNLWTDEELT